MLTINVTLLLAVIVVLRLRRRTQARSRNDEYLSAAIVLVLGVLLAPTKFGHGVVHTVAQLAQDIAHIHI